jgi:hypothetical protein
VDTHVHHSACMHQKHLLRFIKSKLRKEPDEVVIFRDGKYLTLREVFESLNMTGCGPPSIIYWPLPTNAWAFMSCLGNLLCVSCVREKDPI